MKRTLLLGGILLLGMGIGSANDGVITLDLTKSTTPLQFNPENGSWTGTYDDVATYFVS